MLERAAGKNISQSGDTPSRRVIGLALEPVVQDMRVDPGNRDGGTNPYDDQHHQRKNDPLTQLWNLKDIRESRDHQNPRLTTNNHCSPSLLDLLARRVVELIGFYHQFFRRLT